MHLRHSSSRLFRSFEFQGHSTAASLIFFRRGAGRLAQLPTSLPRTLVATSDPSEGQSSGNREGESRLLHAPQAPLILDVHPKLGFLRARVYSSRLALLGSPRALRHRGPTAQHRGADGLRTPSHGVRGGGSARGRDRSGLGWGPVPGLWRLLEARRARPRPALRDGAHASAQHAPPVAAGVEPSLLLRVALRGATFGFGVGILRAGWGRRGSDRGSEAGEQEHGAQPPRGRAVGQPERQRHLRAGPGRAGLRGGRPCARSRPARRCHGHGGTRLRVASGLGKVGRTLLSPHPESRGGMETPRGLSGTQEEPVSAGAASASH